MAASCKRMWALIETINRVGLVAQTPRDRHIKKPPSAEAGLPPPEMDRLQPCGKRPNNMITDRRYVRRRDLHISRAMPGGDEAVSTNRKVRIRALHGGI